MQDSVGGGSSEAGSEEPAIAAAPTPTDAQDTSKEGGTEEGGGAEEVGSGAEGAEAGGAQAEEDKCSSLEHIKSSELHPKPIMKVDEDEALQVPYPLLCGEGVEYMGRCADDGIIALSNYRLFVRSPQQVINVPLGMIETVECRDIFYLSIYGKDAHSFRCTFSTNQACLQWYTRINNAIQPPSQLDNTFAFAYHAWCMSSSCSTGNGVVSNGGNGTTEGSVCSSSGTSSPGGGIGSPAATLCNGGGGGGRPEMAEEPATSYLCRVEVTTPYTFGREVDRLGFLNKKLWRICYINENFGMCRTYPKLHIVPSSVDDALMRSVCTFRSCQRFPSIVWRHPKNGAVIARSSQPEVGWLCWRKSEDEHLLNAIMETCLKESSSSPVQNGTAEPTTDPESSSAAAGVVASNGVVNGTSTPYPANKKLLIIDARSYTAAVANRAKGGGYESTDYYTSSEIQFMSLANIHTIRKSFHSLRLLCSSATTDQNTWLTGLDTTRWLSHVSALLRASLLVVHAVGTEARPVLVHCSDGWDRTPQISATAQLMLDPYYRTIEGFRMLVEREWLEFGHKFADRCGIGNASDDVNERCPVFLQWLDCVYQILNQCPCAFQFNQAYLVKLAQHTYSCLFGTFLGNNAKDRAVGNTGIKTTSLWTMLNPNNKNFINALYVDDPTQFQTLQPSVKVRDLVLWRAVYLSEGTATTTTSAPVPDPPTPSAGDDSEAAAAFAPLTKTRSCENLATGTGVSAEGGEMGPRRLSDPFLAAPAPPADSVKYKADSNGGEVELAGLGNGGLETKTSGTGLSSGGSSSTAVTTTGTTTSDPGSVVCQQPTGSSQTSSAAATTTATASVQINTEEGEEISITRKGEEDDNNEELDSQQQQHQQRQFCDSSSSVEDGAFIGIGARKKEGSQYGIRGFGGRSSVEGSTETLTGCTADNSRTSQYSPILRRPLASSSEAAHMSTSTSDISDSRVLNNKTPLDNALLSLSMGAGVAGGTAGQRQLPAGGSASSTTAAVAASLVGNALRVDIRGCQSAAGHSTDSETSGSPSPRQEYKSLSTGGQRGGSGGPWWSASRPPLDVDGLTVFVDPVQARMSALEAEYNRRLYYLEKQLSYAKAALNCYVSRGAIMDPAQLASLESEGGSSAAVDNVGEGSGTSDAGSWEHVDESEAELTKWIPDHAATHCAVCHGEFWMARRRHHCRKCGRVFCSDCSQNCVPLPEQNLEVPVRVCNRCYVTTNAVTGHNGAEESSSSPALMYN